MAAQFPRRKPVAYRVGIAIGLSACVLLSTSAGERYLAHGPMNAGHEDIACEGCHRPAPGTLRQQIQAGIRFTLGLRGTPADFGYRPVGNESCLDCHERPNDRHPVYRFLEPRFAKAREAVRPHLCVACHAEHRGGRVTIAQLGYCENCHRETRLRKDPLDVSHAQLILLKLWDSCLRCHDFHGNHMRKAERTVEQLIPLETIRRYFDGGPSPYGEARYHKAKKEAGHG
jgi:hypothetical protein